MPSEKRHTLNWSERYHTNRIVSNCMPRNTDPVCGAAYSTSDLERLRGRTPDQMKTSTSSWLKRRWTARGFQTWRSPEAAFARDQYRKMKCALSRFRTTTWGVPPACTPQCPFWVISGKAHREQTSSGSPPISDISQCGWPVSFVPIGDIPTITRPTYPRAR